MRHLLLAWKQPPQGFKAAWATQSMMFSREMIRSLNIIFGSSLDLYAFRFLPCIWGKFLRYAGRLEAAAENDKKRVAEGKRPKELNRVRSVTLLLTEASSQKRTLLFWAAFGHQCSINVHFWSISVLLAFD